MVIQFTCKICSKPVANTHKAIKYDKCDIWIHIECNRINKQTYEMLQKDNSQWFCVVCMKELFPFSNLNDNEFITTTLGKQIKFTSIAKKRTPEKISFLDNINAESDNNPDENISKYYEPHEIKQPIKNTKTTLNTFHLNISSLPAHVTKLQNLLSECNVDFDIIGISESRLIKNKKHLININLPNYNIEHCATESTCGGTLLYIKNDIKYKIRNDLKIYKSEELESVFIEIINKNSKNIIVGCLYRHPSMKDINEFNDQFFNVLSEKLLSEKNKHIILMGDFNIDLLKVESDTKISDFLEQVYATSLKPNITAPTRINTRSKTLIDNIFSTETGENSFSGNILTSISDHLAQFLLFPMKAYEKQKAETYQRNFKNFNEVDFLNDANRLKWNSVLELNKNNTNRSFDKFYETTEKLLDVYAPITRLSKAETKLSSKPWITNGIFNAIKKKNKIYKKFLRAKSEINRTRLYSEFKKYRNKINNLIKVSKAKHYQNFFVSHKNNLFKTWQGVRSIININKNTKKTVNCLNINGKEETDPFHISNSLNTFFTTVAKKIESKIVPTNKHFSEYLQNPNENSFFLTPTSPDEVAETIKNLNFRKALGPNSIPNKALKIIYKAISTPMSDLINLSFETGIHPNLTKTSNVIPAHKKGSQLEANNYRPISLISNISKIIEKIVYKRLYNFLETNVILYEQQYGFRNNHSTNHALIEITEKIREALDKNEFACGTFIDLQKAFDTVNHGILLKKLEHYGIRGIPNNWFRSFLTNRYQFTTVSAQSSAKAEMTHGVPQGSVLGPLLFLIYINDLNKAIVHSKVHHFADDTNLLLTGNSLKKINKFMNHDLRLLCHWLRANKISLNAGKSEIIIFKNKNKQISKNLNFRVSGQKIEITNSVKYLGIHLNDSLTWKSHLTTLLPKLNRAIGLLSKIRYHTPKYLLKTIYYSLFNSHLIYGCQIWGQEKTALFRRIENLQDKALRIINFLPNNFPISPTYEKLNVLKLRDFISLQNALLVKNCLEKNIPPPLQNYFQKVPTRQTTRSSSKNCVRIPTVETATYGTNSIKFKSINIWNEFQHNANLDISGLKYYEAKEKITKHLMKTYII